jgi:hypothetical protein
MRSRGKFGQTNVAMGFSSDESCSQAIYTGSTVGIKDPLPSSELEAKFSLVGMLIGLDGYSPEPYFLTEFLRSQTRFRYPFQDPLFSDAGSSSTYREWSNTNDDRGSPSARGTAPANLTQHE